MYNSGIIVKKGGKKMYAADIVNEVVDAGFIFKPLKGGKYKIFVEEVDK